jgi:putative membrane protein
MVKDHTADVQLYERASQMSQNEALKGYATRTLPTLREHLKQAREISGIKEEAKPGE